MYAEFQISERIMKNSRKDIHKLKQWFTKALNPSIFVYILAGLFIKDWYLYLDTNDFTNSEGDQKTVLQPFCWSCNPNFHNFNVCTFSFRYSVIDLWIYHVTSVVSTYLFSSTHPFLTFYENYMKINVDIVLLFFISEMHFNSNFLFLFLEGSRRF